MNETQLKHLLDLIMKSDWSVDYKLEILDELSTTYSDIMPDTKR